MMPFLIKSTICLIVFYGFYYTFLRNHKILLYNRFFLISSLILSMVIPLIVIPVKTDLIVYSTLERFSVSSEQLFNSEPITDITTPLFNFQNILIALFLMVSLILFLRFSFNIFKILRMILRSKKINNLKTTIVLIPQKTLPYSFFKHIFVNQSDFENGNIEPELFRHEEAHCEQYHSIDILIIEILNIFLWFNPFIWLFRKEIMLNHEYSADNKVLIETNSTDYQQLLVNVLLRNNSNYLVSNFKFSLIKKRINMMTKDKPSNNAILRKITGVIIFLLLSITLTFSEVNVPNNSNSRQVSTGSAFKTGNEKPELLPIKISKEEYTKFSSTFGERRIKLDSKKDSVLFHYGIDFDANFGTDVIATAGGKVIKSEYDDKGYGNLILIDHGDGYQSVYAHLKDFAVKNGDSVTKGQIIGHVGSSGLSTKPHLHFEIRVKGESVNPLTVLK